MIPTVSVSSDRNPRYSTNLGYASQDRVFLLSITEANNYFKSDSARQCKPTAYAKAQGVWTNTDNGNCWWLLRSPGSGQDHAPMSTVTAASASAATVSTAVLTPFAPLCGSIWTLDSSNLQSSTQHRRRNPACAARNFNNAIRAPA